MFVRMNVSIFTRNPKFPLKSHIFPNSNKNETWDEYLGMNDIINKNLYVV